MDSDGLAIRNALVYCFAKMGRFLIDLNMLYYANSPIFEQGGVFYYPDDLFTPDGFPVGLDPTKHFRRFKGLGSLNKEDIYSSFYDPATRRIIRVTDEDIQFGMSMVEDINVRKKFLMDTGIITNPYKWTDL